MNSLIRTEWLKLRKYKAFWWLTALTALSYPGINSLFYFVYKDAVEKKDFTGELAKTLLGNPFAFPEAWHTVAFFSSIFVFIPAVLIIMFITNEYSFKTHRQNIIDGWSRNEFMTGKLLNVVITSVVITLLYFLCALIIGLLSKGGTGMWNLSYYTGLFALQTFSQLSIAFLVGFLIRKAFIALGVFFFYFLIFEPIITAILREKVKGDIGRYLPIEVSDRMIPRPAFMANFNEEGYKTALSQMNIHILYTIILTTIIWLICYRVNSRRDF